MGFYWLNYTHMGYRQKHVYLYQATSRIACKELKLWEQSVTGPRQIEVSHKDRTTRTTAFQYLYKRFIILAT